MCNDNLSSMQIIKNPTSHHRANHIDVRFHFIRDHDGTISLQYIESEKLCADFFTKVVNRVKIHRSFHMRTHQIIDCSSYVYI